MSADNWTTCPKCGGEFREDYEIGMYPDEFYISYRGTCRACDYRHSFSHGDASMIEASS
jgi:C4-type Zn-finger protein